MCVLACLLGCSVGPFPDSQGSFVDTEGFADIEPDASTAGMQQWASLPALARASQTPTLLAVSGGQNALFWNSDIAAAE